MGENREQGIEARLAPLIAPTARVLSHAAWGTDARAPNGLIYAIRRRNATPGGLSAPARFIAINRGFLIISKRILLVESFALAHTSLSNRGSA